MVTTSTPTQFYDRYHLKNQRFSRVIKPHNFTYFYTLDFLHEACRQACLEFGIELTELRVLDVGCGVGTLSLYLADQGAQVVGLDISPRAINLAQLAQHQLGLDTVRFQVGELPHQKLVSSSRFHLVICSEVIEHIPDDEAFAKDLRDQLVRGGYLVLTTPSKDNVLYRRGFYEQFDAEVGHLRRYTPSTLKHFLRSTGWRVQKLRPVEGPLRNFLFTTNWGWVIKFIKGPCISWFHHLDEWSARRWGAADLQVIAQRYD
jgi:ubiquinone biosynthesis O-methyltransferase